MIASCSDECHIRLFQILQRREWVLRKSDICRTGSRAYSVEISRNPQQLSVNPGPTLAGQHDASMPSTPAGGFSNNGNFVGQDGKSQAGWPRGPGQPSAGDTPIDGSATDFGGLAATPSTSRPVTGHQNLLNGLWSQMNHGYSEGNPEVPNQAMQHMPQQPPQAFDLNNIPVRSMQSLVFDD
jgi:hypothetical protein